MEQTLSFPPTQNETTPDRKAVVPFAAQGLDCCVMYLGPGIVLSLVNKQGKDIQGYLRLNELFNLDYPADLIVLSACETGLGKNIQGEGLVGLTRGLMYAGGERLVLSLWQVEDKGTSMLMQEFYKEMLLNGKSGNVAPYPNFLSGYVAKNETNTAQAQVDA